MNFTSIKKRANRVPFKGSKIPGYLIGAAFIAAYDASYGPDAWTGRTPVHNFQKLFIGKLGEEIVAEYFRNRGFRCYRPDGYIENPIGDSGDLFLRYDGKEYNFSIKTSSWYCNYLLEPVDHYSGWNDRYTNNHNDIIFDRHYYVRVNQVLKDIDPNLSKQELYEYVMSLDWQGEIVGYITHEDFIEVTKIPHIIRAGQCNLTKDCYYVQSGDLRKIKTDKI